MNRGRAGRPLATPTFGFQSGAPVTVWHGGKWWAQGKKVPFGRGSEFLGDTQRVRKSRVHFVCKVVSSGWLGYQ
jgi:hypothetical protein